MSVQIMRGDARHLALADDSVDLIVTSPPYFGLRSYQDGGEHYSGQIGDEPTPAEFVDALIDCTREWMRVLKPSGSMWVNLGDKYAGPNNPRNSLGGGDLNWSDDKADRLSTGYRNLAYGVRGKSLIGIPWRYALRCIDDLGLILRAEVIWSKPNGLPESVTDRVRRSHETWFHLVRQPRYFSAVDEIRLPTNSPRRAGLAASSRPALGPELRATLHTDNGPAVARGWCQLGSLQESIGAGVARQTQGFEVVEPVGFLLRVEGPERDYVVDLEASRGAASDATVSIAVERALADLTPSDAPPRPVAAGPAGVLLAGPVVGDAFGRAEVLDLECAPIAREGIAARVTLGFDQGRATLLVWDAFAGHLVSLPQNSDPLGKLPGSVWEIPTEPLRVPDHLGVDHFAAFPTAWPKRLILGWSPSGVCEGCGEGRRPVVEVNRALEPGRRVQGLGATYSDTRVGPQDFGGTSYLHMTAERTVTGYTCRCIEAMRSDPASVDAFTHGPPPTRPSVVLDPFGGTGTTALVAHALGRHGISNDRSADYCRLARWRTTDPGQLAKVLGVPKPPTEIDGQADLFGDVA